MFKALRTLDVAGSECQVFLMAMVVCLRRWTLDVAGSRYKVLSFLEGINTKKI